MPASEETYRSQPILHLVFAISSIAMLLATVWMVMDDHLRPWKQVQREFQQVERDKLDATLKEKHGKLDILVHSVAFAPADAMHNDFLETTRESFRIAHDVSVAASHFLLNQLPEFYTAPERTESNFPVQYIGANVPQAWAAGSVFMLTQALLGFLPDAPRSKLYVDPWLPAWLPDLTIRDLRVGRHELDIRFWRDGEETQFKVLNGDAQVVERCALRSKMAWLPTAS